jgi:outer membrane protein insertion porin family
MNRFCARCLRPLYVGLALSWGLSPDAASAAPSDPLPLVLDEVVLQGNTRTSPEVVQRYLSLPAGEPVTPERILEAVEALRTAELFRSVEFRTERGRERGHVRLILDVEERGLEFGLGAGYQDLDGWYVVPAQLRWDNRLGRGERTRVSLKFGYRITGVEGTLEEPHFGSDGRGFWGISVGAFGLQRRYFLDGVEYRHPVSQGFVGAHLGRRFGRGWSVEVGARFETMDADSTAKAAENDEVRGVEKGDELPHDDLPPDIASSVGQRPGQVYHVQLSFDGRSARRVASTPVSGFWGRVLAEGLLREDAEAGAVTVDLRAYRAAFGGAFAARGRGGVIGSRAAFYDRFYLGGLYTVRGVPPQSLSPAEGDTRFWSASLEFRGPMAGRPDRPIVMAVLFVDAGQGWQNAAPPADDVSASAGFGFRIRVPWLDSLGFDFGVPIGRSPVGESFHAHGALGWNF